LARLYSQNSQFNRFLVTNRGEISEQRRTQDKQRGFANKQ